MLVLSRRPGESVVVGGGLAPCGLAADPSGDVWVANCYAVGQYSTVVRVDADTLVFEKTIRVPYRDGYFKGVAYGGGSLWVADTSGASTGDDGVTQVDPQSGAQHPIKFERHAGWLAWSEGYGDLWMNDFTYGSVSRLHAETGDVKTYDQVTVNPGSLVVAGDSVWVDDWSNPQVARIPAVGAGRVRRIPLSTEISYSGSTGVAAGAGAIWLVLPSDRALWRIDPKTGKTTRVELPYHPWGVSATDDAVWVSLRPQDA